jgi:hypothetical protein
MGLEQLTKAERRQKLWWEVKDLLTGAAFPFIILIVFSTSVMMFAEYDDLAIKLVATIGGLIFIIIAYIIFGRQNGAAAYRKLVLGSKKRELGTTDKKAIYKTGEYAVYKGFLIGFITVIPYVILQIVNIIVPNNVVEFLLIYACGWAYYPFKLFGAPEAVNLVMIILPIGVHALGYYLGKIKEIDMQKKITEESNKSKKKKSKK